MPIDVPESERVQAMLAERANVALRHRENPKTRFERVEAIDAELQRHGIDTSALEQVAPPSRRARAAELVAELHALGVDVDVAGQLEDTEDHTPTERRGRRGRAGEGDQP